MIYNKTKLDRSSACPSRRSAGRWEELIAWGAAGHREERRQGWGTMDPSADYKALWVWLRQQGKDLYNGKQARLHRGTTWPSGSSCGRAPATAKRHPDRPTSSTRRNGSDVTKQLVVTGKAATSFMWVQPDRRAAEEHQERAGRGRLPGRPEGPVGPRLDVLVGVRAARKNATPSVDVINFLVNDPEAGKILGTDRGLPSNLDVREAGRGDA